MPTHMIAQISLTLELVQGQSLSGGQGMSLMDYVSKETGQATVSNYRNRLCLL